MQMNRRDVGLSALSTTAFLLAGISICPPAHAAVTGEIAKWLWRFCTVACGPALEALLNKVVPNQSDPKITPAVVVPRSMQTTVAFDIQEIGDSLLATGRRIMDPRFGLLALANMVILDPSPANLRAFQIALAGTLSDGDIALRRVQNLRLRYREIGFSGKDAETLNEKEIDRVSHDIEDLRQAQSVLAKEKLTPDDVAAIKELAGSLPKLASDMEASSKLADKTAQLVRCLAGCA